jgi:GntR family transcriptional regulator/MocR family aminotransferase
MPITRWLCVALRGEILAGRLRPGVRLPASRDLARQHGVSRGAVVNAFEQLRAEGYVEGSVGSGTYVCRILPDDLLQVTRDARVEPGPRIDPPRRLSGFGRRASRFPGFSFRPVRAFRGEQPALDLFPTTLWAQTAGRRLRRATTTDLLGCGPMGYRPLREAVADYLGTSRGVRCTPEQVAIVSGVQEALDLVARIFLDPGDRVCMEEPGYPGASLVFEALGAEIVPVQCDAEGMKPPSARLRGARLAYLTPGHQYPLGTSMSLRRRLALLEWARRTGAVIVEDDYDSEFRYAQRPVPALQALDRDGLVLFAGSFGKVLYPSLRLGYLVIPPDLVDRFDAARSITTRHPPLQEQAVLCDFIVEGHFARHLRCMREVYAERASVLVECARQRLGGLLEVGPIAGGLQTPGWLGAGIDGTSATAAAARRDVEVTPLSRYARRPMRREGLQLGFAAVDPEAIRRGVLQLAAALEAESRRSG